MICTLERLHPCKKDKILAGLLLLEERNRQRKLNDKVIVFGSTVMESCTEDSDIDVCIVSPFTCEDEGYFRMYCDFYETWLEERGYGKGYCCL